MSGWIKAHRALCTWEWYKDANTFRVFFHLLLNANYEPSRFMGVSIPIGSLPTGRNAIASALGISPDQVRTALSHLHSTQEITQQAHAKFSVITITNWSSYQEDAKEIPSSSPARPQLVPTLKEGKKGRREEVDIPKPESVGDPIWRDFVAIRKKKNAPITQTAINGIIKESVKAGITLESALAECCTRGWQSFKADWYNNAGKNNVNEKDIYKGVSFD